MNSYLKDAVSYIRILHENLFRFLKLGKVKVRKQYKFECFWPG